MKLLIVDLEYLGTNINGDAKVSIGVLIGMPYSRNGLQTIEHFYKIFLGVRHITCSMDPENILD
jgi:hypothetical protein